MKKFLYDFFNDPRDSGWKVCENDTKNQTVGEWRFSVTMLIVFAIVMCVAYSIGLAFE